MSIWLATLRSPAGKGFPDVKVRVTRRSPTQERISMNKKLVCAVPLAATVAFGLYACGGDDNQSNDISSVKNVVVIYA